MIDPLRHMCQRRQLCEISDSLLRFISSKVYKIFPSSLWVVKMTLSAVRLEVKSMMRLTDQIANCVGAWRES